MKQSATSLTYCPKSGYFFLTERPKLEVRAQPTATLRRRQWQCRQSHQEDEGLSRAKFTTWRHFKHKTSEINRSTTKAKGTGLQKYTNICKIVLRVQTGKKIAKCIWRREDTARVLQGASNATTTNKLIMTTILSILRTKVATKCLTRGKRLKRKSVQKAYKKWLRKTIWKAWQSVSCSARALYGSLTIFQCFKVKLVNLT